MTGLAKEMSENIKKEPDPIAAESDSMDDSDMDVSYNHYTPDRPKCQGEMYTFDRGAVRMDYLEGIYRIYYHGEEISEDIVRNPMIAIMRFESAVGQHLREKAKGYLAKCGHNTVMGCKINLPCSECRAMGLNTVYSRCIMGDIRS